MSLTELTVEEQKETNGGIFLFVVALAFYVGYKDAENSSK